MVEIAIEHSRCLKDGLCAVVCPGKVFVHHEAAEEPRVLGGERCIACGHCLAICPAAAISHSAVPQSSIFPIQADRMPAYEQVIELLRSRRSIRAFRDSPLDPHTIEAIIDGARFAPSGHNSQSTEFLVVLDQDVLSRLSAAAVGYVKFELGRLNALLVQAVLMLVGRKLLERWRKEVPVFEAVLRSFEAGQDPILHHAPALIIFHARSDVGLADVNAHLALQNASLVAHSLGVGHFYPGWIVAACRAPASPGWRRRIPDLVGLPTGNRIHGALALGYPVQRYKNWIERKPARIHWL